MRPIFVIQALMGVSAIAVTTCGGSSSSSSTSTDDECMEMRDGGLCTVDVRKHTFRAPNPLLPDDIRGVYWIDAGNMTGKSNPWVDLNFLQKLPPSSSSSSSWFGGAVGDSDLLYVMDGTCVCLRHQNNFQVLLPLNEQRSTCALKPCHNSNAALPVVGRCSRVLSLRLLVA